MAKSILLSPFIRSIEGGLSKNPNDAAAANPCPFPYQGQIWHTNQGWTWEEWSSIMGNDQTSATRFFTMSITDWDDLFQKYYWNMCLADDINSQRISNLIVDMFFNSGKYAALDVQEMLDTLFGDNLTEDGKIGKETIADINAANEQDFYTDFIARRIQFYKDICLRNPKEEPNLDGWINRVNKLVTYNNQFN